ncbi:hypothetical protein M6D81_18630 [Paenibacillus sp. J5C_2022]|uniref:hypothetical protein n=1 Tax=Paenibacillus sp. J5C2022 TaxID=2977129 RepID=UPI0021D13703|nr:hypothetical protein [Paenibacillus sp. J5C2022]MCU6710710.1 hypothetical protein [Paenibacillus sp. J5C2022]
MKTVKIPGFLHDVFGEKQTWATIITIFACSIALTGTIYFLYPEMVEGIPLWRSLIALILMWDIFAGCVANFTASTSNFYAERPLNRIVFISIHVHILVVAFCLNEDIGYATAVWAFTIAGAFLVNSLVQPQRQVFLAGLLLTIGIAGQLLWRDVEPYMLVTGMLFMLKVLYSFSVNHYGHSAQKKGGRG